MNNERYLWTGNDLFALPLFRAQDAALESCNVISMQYDGLLGCFGDPLADFDLFLDGEKVRHRGRWRWDFEGDWIIRGELDVPRGRMIFHLFAPPGERGAVFRWCLENSAETSRCFEVIFRWHGGMLSHGTNLWKPLAEKTVAVCGSWDGFSALEYRLPFPALAFSFCPLEGEGRSEWFLNGRRWKPGKGRREKEARGGVWRLSLKSRVAPGKEAFLSAGVGVGREEIAAVTAARDLLRKGAPAALQETRRFLESRRFVLREPHMEKLANRNAFFNRFFAAGRALDTGEAVALTSRSPLYYVCGAYWDRDSLLWSHPCLLEQEPSFAQELLVYALERQGRHAGIHSRYLGGGVLEAGFELDEACAPLVAARRQMEREQERESPWWELLPRTLGRFEETLKAHRHPKISFYRTQLLPSDDPWPQPYVIYDNVLVWRALQDGAKLWEKLGRKDKAAVFLREAKSLRAAIRKYGVVQGRFAWSLDLQGGHLFYDEPPGSLLLLPFYGFCSFRDSAWLRTKKWIYEESTYAFSKAPYREIGCAHAPHPWVLSAANSLLAGEVPRASAFLKAPLDEGFACESVNEHTGYPATGRAFATCAGFLAFALKKVFGAQKEKA